MRFLAVAGALVFALGCGGGGSEHGGKIKWTRDIEGGLAESQESGKPAALFFTADW